MYIATPLKAGRLLFPLCGTAASKQASPISRVDGSWRRKYFLPQHLVSIACSRRCVSYHPGPPRVDRTKDFVLEKHEERLSSSTYATGGARETTMRKAVRRQVRQRHPCTVLVCTPSLGVHGTCFSRFSATVHCRTPPRLRRGTSRYGGASITARHERAIFSLSLTDLCFGFLACENPRWSCRFIFHCGGVSGKSWRDDSTARRGRWERRGKVVPWL